MDYDYNKSTALIIGMTDTGEKVTAASGRISTQEGTALSIWDKSQDKEKNENLISKVTRSGHNSVVEHTYFNLAFQNVSAVVEQFIIEFRLASFTVKSRRYVNFSDAGFYVPDFEDKQTEKLYVDHMTKMFDLYTELTQNGIPREDARFVLPYCLYSNFFCSVNGREFLNMLKAMLGRGAKFPEIRKLGTELLKQAKEKAPGIMADFEERMLSGAFSPDLGFLEKTHPRCYECKPKQQVELLSYSENGAKSVARNALIEYGNYASDEIEKILAENDNTDKIIKAVLCSGRPRALECVNYTLRFNNVSLSCITHFARHRMQSIQIPSLEITNRSNYIIPPSLKDKPELLEKYKNAFYETEQERRRMESLQAGDDVLVYYQLSGNTLDIVTTMNARELLLFMRLRSCNRAQWEIREYAVEALSLLRKVEPKLFSQYGPSCFIGKCPEGRLSCGKAPEVKEKFRTF